MRNLLISLFAALALCGMARPAAAAITCTSSYSDVVFGSFDVLAGSAVTATGTANLNCSGGAANTSYRFCSNLRAGPDAVGSQRYMANLASPFNLLPFNIYQDAAHTIPFGNFVTPYLGGGLQADISTNGSGVISLSGVTVMYGVVPPSQQTVNAGSYQEYMANVSTQQLFYGTLTSANIPCDTGANTIQIGFYVTGTVIPNCNIASISGLTFAPSSALTSNVDTTGSISVQCTNTTPYSISLGNGNYVSGSQRRMHSVATGGYISYDVYTDAGHTSAWTTSTSASSCTSGGSTCALGTGTGVTQPAVTVYGRVPPQTTPLIGIYTDTVVVTVTY